MPETSSSNKRIAKNTLMLYVRMLFSMAVSLYTSRVVLQTLGVSDYGVYSVVGGVVGMLGFLNATMSGATSRFLTYELGRGNKEQLSQTFNAALIVHIGIALLVFVVAETLGLWFVYHKLVIPDGRMTAALWVYQFSILSAIISITQVPYNASIIAHERMDIYAYVEILHTILKLAIVYVLLVFDIDKLILYGLLLFGVTFLIAMINRIYSIRHYQECCFQMRTQRNIIKGILSFSGYNLFGNFGSIFNRQGTNIVINLFYGVEFNAASGLATTIADSISSFAHNVITAFRPNITKAYAVEKYQEQEQLTLMALKLSIFMIALVSIPAILEMNFIIRTWLGIVPDGMEPFAKLIVLANLFEIIKYIFVINVHATGNVKNVSIATGLILALNPFFIYITFIIVKNVIFAYICYSVTQALLAIVVIYITKKQIPHFMIFPMLIAIGKILLVAFIVYIVMSFFLLTMNQGIIRLLLSLLISCVLFSVLTYYFCIDINQKKYIKSVVKKKISSIVKSKL